MQENNYDSSNIKVLKGQRQYKKTRHALEIQMMVVGFIKWYTRSWITL